jgi:hypothetical protein
MKLPVIFPRKKRVEKKGQVSLGVSFGNETSSELPIEKWWRARGGWKSIKTRWEFHMKMMLLMILDGLPSSPFSPVPRKKRVEEKGRKEVNRVERSIHHATRRDWPSSRAQVWRRPPQCLQLGLGGWLGGCTRKWDTSKSRHVFVA